MGSTQTITKDDFVILGPTLAPGNNVLEAIHSLYFLPDNYKLVFTGTTPVDTDFYAQVVRLVEHDDLGGRVRFAENAAESHAVILPHRRQSRARNSITGDSPEALASAILNIARATV